MSRKPAVRFGQPLAEVPEPRVPSNTGRGAEHWAMVADHCTENPGVWHPVAIAQLTVERHRQAVGGINSRDLLAFRPAGFKAAFREGQLYVRYDAPADVEVPTPIRRRKSA